MSHRQEHSWVYELVAWYIEQANYFLAASRAKARSARRRL